MKKERIDVLLVERGLAESRNVAQSIIMSGNVYVNEQKVDKAGTQVDREADIYVKEKSKYVSRAGYKLEGAIENFGLDFGGKAVLDIGSSTGGFLDAMLQYGADVAYGVDVGYGLLHEKLVANPNVTNIEKQNFRHIEYEVINRKFDFITTDVSFISLAFIVPKAIIFATNDTQFLFLIKPQFEAGAKFVQKNGIVRDLDVHVDVIHKMIEIFAHYGLVLKGLAQSKLHGAKGNVEYTAYCVVEASIDSSSKPFESFSYATYFGDEFSDKINEMIRKVVYDGYNYCMPQEK